MAPNDLQRFIDSHRSLFIAIFPLYFIALWLLVAAVISVVGGWFSLSRRYRTRVPFKGTKWTMQSGQMRWRVNYNNVLTIGVSEEGLYLACMFLFRFMHPPMLIPWDEIKVRRNEGWIFKYLTFMMGREAAIPLKTRAKLADRLRNQAGNKWPVEEV